MGLHVSSGVEVDVGSAVVDYRPADGQPLALTRWPGVVGAIVWGCAVADFLLV